MTTVTVRHAPVERSSIASRGLETRASVLKGLRVAQLLLVLGLYAPIALTGGQPNFNELGLESACMVAVGVCSWALLSAFLAARTLWDPRVLLTLSLVLFNAGQLIYHLLLPEEELFFGWFSEAQIIPAAYYVAVCIATWSLGMLMLAGRNDRAASPVAVGTVRGLFRIGFLFFLVALLPVVWQIRETLQVVASGGYLALYQQDVVVGFAAWQDVLGRFFVPGALIVVAAGRDHARLRRVATGALLLYAAAQFAAGHRSAALLPLLAFFFVWHHSVRRISRAVTVSVLALLAGVVIPSIAILRTTNTMADFSPAAIAEALSSTENPFFATIHEFGGSMSTVVHSLQLVPAQRPHDNGMGYVRSLYTIVPSLSGERNAGVAEGTYSGWLIWTVDPATAAAGGGLGFSAIAESYVNFGWVGGPLMFLVLSLLGHALLARFGDYRHALHVVVSGVFLNAMLFWPRAETVAVVRPIVWFALVPAALLWFLRQARRASWRA